MTSRQWGRYTKFHSQGRRKHATTPVFENLQVSIKVNPEIPICVNKTICKSKPADFGNIDNEMTHYNSFTRSISETISNIGERNNDHAIHHNLSSVVPTTLTISLEIKDFLAFRATGFIFYTYILFCQVIY